MERAGMAADRLPVCGWLCFSITPAAEEKGKGGAMACAPFGGVARTPRTKGNASDEMRISFVYGSGGEELPAYIAGPVTEEAASVVVRFPGRDVLRVATFPGPESLQHIRFYATQLPAGIEMTPSRNPPGAFPISVAGLDASGNIVACLAPTTAREGASAVADCR